VSTYFSW